jgi:alpha-beta hydrolase superfamily lysophospholipase
MSTRKPETEMWKNSAGQSFRFMHWPHPDGPQKTLVLIHHGHGEHAGRWQTMADALADLPVDVRAYDLRGHGESEGKRGDANGYGQFADDLLEIWPVMLEKSGAERVLLVGHSMGAAAVAYTLIHRTPPKELAGVILSSGLFLMPRTVINSIKIALGRPMSKILPGLQMDTALPATVISNDPAEVKRYAEDPLIHSKVTTRLGASWETDGETLPDLAKNFPDVPLLITTGVADKAVDPQGTHRFAKNVPHANVEYVRFEGGFHEPHHDAAADAQKVKDVWHKWVEAHLN